MTKEVRRKLKKILPSLLVDFIYKFMGLKRFLLLPKFFKQYWKFAAMNKKSGRKMELNFRDIFPRLVS